MDIMNHHIDIDFGFGDDAAMPGLPVGPGMDLDQPGIDEPELDVIDDWDQDLHEGAHDDIEAELHDGIDAELPDDLHEDLADDLGHGEDHDIVDDQVPPILIDDAPGADHVGDDVANPEDGDIVEDVVVLDTPASQPEGDTTAITQLDEFLSSHGVDPQEFEAAMNGGLTTALEGAGIATTPVSGSAELLNLHDAGNEILVSVGPGSLPGGPGSVSGGPGAIGGPSPIGLVDTPDGVGPTDGIDMPGDLAIGVPSEDGTMLDVALPEGTMSIPMADLDSMPMIHSPSGDSGLPDDGTIALGAAGLVIVGAGAFGVRRFRNSRG